VGKLPLPLAWESVTADVSQRDNEGARCFRKMGGGGEYSTRAAGSIGMRGVGNMVVVLGLRRAEGCYK